MKPKYIDVNSLVVAYSGHTLDDDFTAGVNYVLDLLEEKQGEDVRPMMRGEWLGGEFDGYADGYPVYDTMLCSECGAEYDADIAETSNFCPSCGAKMEVEHE